MLAPNAAGLSLAAIVTGKLTTRSGRYKHWVVGGSGLLVVAIAITSRLDSSWNNLTIAAVLVLIGMALGAALPVLSTASQNAVELPDLGVVTAAVTFFRTLGGTIGIAVLGAVLKGRFDHLLEGIARTETLPAGATARTLADRPAEIHALQQPLRALVQNAMADSVAAVFLAALPLAVVVFGISWMLEERPLKESTTLNIKANDAARNIRPTSVEGTGSRPAPPA